MIRGVFLIDSTSFNFKKLCNLHIPAMNLLISIDKMLEGNICSSEWERKDLF